MPVAPSGHGSLKADPKNPVQLGESGIQERARTWLPPRRVEREGLLQGLDTVRERTVLILLCTLLTVGSALVYLKVASPSYRAEAELLVTPVSAQDQSYVGLGLISNTNDPARDVLTASRLVTSSAVARLVVEDLQYRATPLRLLNMVQAKPVTQSNVVAVSATAASPDEAQRIANSFAEQTIVERTASLHRKLDLLLPRLDEQLAATPDDPRTGASSLNDRYRSLLVLRSGNDPTLQVIAPAVLPEHPVSPRPRLTIAAAVFGGLVIGLTAAFGLGAIDQVLRREEQLRNVIDLPVLGRIPLVRGWRGSRPVAPAGLTAAGREAFRSLRTSISAGLSSEESTSVLPPAAHGGTKPQLITPSRRPERVVSRVIFIAGSTTAEGTSTTAINLAVSFAELGEVILIEADLRRPAVGAALGVVPLHGLEDVMLDAVKIDDALVDAGPNLGMVRLLLAGGPNSEHASRISLPAAERIVSEARARAPFVVIDSPPLTEVADGLAFAHQADDILIVARRNRSRLRNIADLGELLFRYSFHPLGVAFVGVKESRSFRRGVFRRLRDGR